jgi:hypothetical protein
MDGTIAGGLIAAGVSLGMNGIGWAIASINQAKRDEFAKGALKQALDDVCKDVKANEGKIDKVEQKVDKVDDKITSHIINHPGRTVRK